MDIFANEATATISMLINLSNLRRVKSSSAEVTNARNVLRHNFLLRHVLTVSVHFARFPYRFKTDIRK